MARKKKTEEATAAVVDAAPVAEVVVETAAVVDAPPADAVEWPPNDAPDEASEAPADDEATEGEVERARLAELWRLNGIGELEGIGEFLRGLMPGIKALSDVHRPAQLGERALTTAELIAALEEAGRPNAATKLRRWYRANHRRAGISIYVLLALAALDEESADEQGQEGQAEGS
jgi:hypothetical protein